MSKKSPESMVKMMMWATIVLWLLVMIIVGFVIYHYVAKYW